MIYIAIWPVSTTVNWIGLQVVALEAMFISYMTSGALTSTCKVKWGGFSRQKSSRMVSPMCGVYIYITKPNQNRTQGVLSQNFEASSLPRNKTPSKSSLSFWRYLDLSSIKLTAANIHLWLCANWASCWAQQCLSEVCSWARNRLASK